MSQFINYSQEIKKEIRNNPLILKSIQYAFDGTSQPFSNGTQHAIYRLGKTQSGIFLVLRIKIYYKITEFDINYFNNYCNNAETIQQLKVSEKSFYKNKRSPNFCIGLIYQEKLLGVITEDMSEGGKYEMSNDMGSCYSTRILSGQVVDEVFTDLDGVHVDFDEILENSPNRDYFSKELVLKIQ